MDSIDIPKNVHSALLDPRWKATVEEEMDALLKNNAWEIINLPQGKKVVGCKWIFTMKFKSNE